MVAQNFGGGRIHSVFKRFAHSYDNIISLENLLRAWNEFKRGKTKKKDVQEFEYRLFDNILDLHNDLKAKTYTHGPYHAFTVNDPKRRDIHKASVRDRLLHHAIYRILYPYFDLQFIHDSYSCRKGKGTHRALLRFEQMSRKVSQNYTKQCFVLKCDIRKFFASIDHNVLLSVLERYIKDEDILWLLSDVVGSFCSNVCNSRVVLCHPRVGGDPELDSRFHGNDRREDDKQGLPLGNLTSQLFANIYMNVFDQFVKHKIKAEYYIRYADDFVFLSHNKQYLETLLPIISDFLSSTLKLSLHKYKVFIKTFSSGVDFLGWVHFSNHRVLRTVTKRRMFRKIGEVDCKPETITSYVGMLKWGNGWKITKHLPLIR